MSVYIDKSRNPYGRMIMCHLMADTLDELHAFAKQIGMKRSWYQPLSVPHYDVSLSMRKKTIEAGAVEVDRKEMVRIIRKWRKSNAS